MKIDIELPDLNYEEWCDIKRTLRTCWYTYNEDMDWNEEKGTYQEVYDRRVRISNILDNLITQIEDV